MKNLKNHYLLLSLINFLAILVSAYLTYMHFKPELTDICNLSEKWNCDIVNKSVYSEIFGIPVSILGLIAYTAFLTFSIRGLRHDQSKWLPYFLFFVAGGTAFALYLTGIEAFVLRTFCLFCVTQQVLILIELFLAIRLTLLTRKHA
jgi:vitamin-K-epoxide reductase (warfarin-sensitive)